MKNNILIILVLLLPFYGCYDDQGNYEYMDINEIIIDTVGLQTFFDINQFDTLRIEPAIRFAKETVSDADMNYTWTIFNDAYNNTASEVIGTARTLKSAVKQPSSATSYSVVLDAKNKLTGVAAQMTYTVYVSSEVVSGVVVLHTNGQQNDIDYIATPNAVPTIKTKRRIRNAYFTANGVKIPGTANFVGAARRNNTVINSVYIGTKEELYKVTGKTFELESTSQEMFPVLPVTRNFQNFMTIGNNNYQFLINDGKLHNIANQNAWEITFSYALEANTTLKPQAICLAPFIYVPEAPYTTQFGGVFYDQQGKRFVMRPNNTMQIAKISPFNAQASSVFDVNNIGMDILSFERGYQNYGYAVFQGNSVSEKWLYIANFNKAMDASIAVGKYDMSGLPEIADAKFYTTGSRGDVFLYATGKDIYTYDYKGSNTAVKINDSFAADEIITCMKIYKPWATANDLTKADGTLLYVATWDGKQGRLYEFSMNETNGYLRSKTALDVSDGMGKIVDFCFKVQGTGIDS